MTRLAKQILPTREPKDDSKHSRKDKNYSSVLFFQYLNPPIVELERLEIS